MRLFYWRVRPKRKKPMCQFIISTAVAVVVGIVTGIATSYCVASRFYKRGKADTERSYRALFLTLVTLKIKQMVPTSRKRTPEHYDLKDTSHWLTCASEIVKEMGFTADAIALEQVRDGLDDAPIFENPTKDQNANGEAYKIEWQKIIHDQIHKINNEA